MLIHFSTRQKAPVNKVFCKNNMLKAQFYTLYSQNIY